MTNFERMKSMTQEEMAHELALIASWDRKEYKKAINTIGLEQFMNKRLQSEVTPKMQLKENEDDA